jgi:hypothetical protein
MDTDDAMNAYYSTGLNRAREDLSPLMFHNDPGPATSQVANPVLQSGNLKF